jgi:hypothetical protein
MKELKPGDQVVGLSNDGAGVEVYKLVKVWTDGVQAEDTSGQLSKASLRAYDEQLVNALLEKTEQIKTIKQEIRGIFESMQKIG